MLTPNDIRNPERKSGFNFVATHPTWRTSAGDRFRAQYQRVKPHWYGPTRGSADEAAQDYCDFVNGLGTPRKPHQPRKVGGLTVSLRGAGHKTRYGGIAKGAVRRKQAGDGRQAEKLGYVYCISEEGMHTAVKIGYSQDATLRIGALQTGNPRKLVILGVLRGTEADERELHAEYIDQNVLGEWFRPTPALLSEFGIEKEMIA